MAYRKNGVEEILRQFIREARKRLPVEKIILFGSHAQGKPKETSDIDLAVISSKFSRMNGFARIKLLLDCAHRIKYGFSVDIETFGYTPKEYKDAGYFDFLGVIKKTGKVIYQS